VEQNESHISKFRAKDHLVSGEYFDIIWNESRTIAKTNIENIKDISLYYNSSNYDSFKNTAKGTLDIIYFLIQKIMFRYKLFLLRIYLKGNRILDYGAGSGKFAAYLSKKKFNTSVVEPYNKEIKNQLPLNINVFEKITDIPKSDYYDGITLWHVLEHLSNPEHVLSKIHNLLEKNGVLMIAVPNISSLDARYYKSYWAALDVPRHIWHYTIKGIISLVESKGFKLEKKYPLFFDAFYVSYISETRKNSRFSMIRGFFFALLSNFSALFNKEFSSMIFIFKKTI
tara:strand:+ start:9991 stop:10842 length:852 start_codon:yes stop_codon:yes gene_type:complete